MKQSDIWYLEEGDSYHKRNFGKSRYPDPVTATIRDSGIRPEKVLEIGCGDGWRLRDIKAEFGSECCGIDASRLALPSTNERFFYVHGTADEIRDYFMDDSVDLIIFGFVLYQVDREDLFKILFKTDCVLKDGGHIIIHDFYSEEPKTVPYHHDPRLKTYKMDYAKLWLAHPWYTRVDLKFFGSGDGDETIVSLLRKQVS